MTFIIQQTLLYAVPLMIVALAGVFAERSGIINLALEGIMIFGAFIGVLFVRTMQDFEVFTAAVRAGDWLTLQGLELLAMLVAAILGALFSLLLSFASINLKADQTIGGTALNLMAPALVLFLVRILANQNTLQMATGDAASWFMLKKSTFGIDKSVDLGFLGETFLNKVYLATYICIIIFVVLSIILYKTRFGLRLRACGENPQAADSLGIYQKSQQTAIVIHADLITLLNEKGYETANIPTTYWDIDGDKLLHVAAGVKGGSKFEFYGYSDDETVNLVYDQIVYLTAPDLDSSERESYETSLSDGNKMFTIVIDGVHYLVMYKNDTVIYAYSSDSLNEINEILTDIGYL